MWSLKILTYNHGKYTVSEGQDDQVDEVFLVWQDGVFTWSLELRPTLEPDRPDPQQHTPRGKKWSQCWRWCWVFQRTAPAGKINKNEEEEGGRRREKEKTRDKSLVSILVVVLNFSKINTEFYPLFQVKLFPVI